MVSNRQGGSNHAIQLQHPRRDPLQARPVRDGLGPDLDQPTAGEATTAERTRDDGRPGVARQGNAAMAGLGSAGRLPLSSDGRRGEFTRVPRTGAHPPRPGPVRGTLARDAAAEAVGSAWRGGRVVDGSGLENRRGESLRGFESRPLRSWRSWDLQPRSRASGKGSMPQSCPCWKRPESGRRFRPQTSTGLGRSAFSPPGGSAQPEPERRSVTLQGSLAPSGIRALQESRPTVLGSPTDAGWIRRTQPWGQQQETESRGIVVPLGLLGRWLHRDWLGQKRPGSVATTGPGPASATDRAAAR